ncbi:MAG: winged helix-turn-helix transcriptional regulator [Candidatus Pacebacteria bacterium]|nr:winged helix-turn-helix transcriptional regulator [Candidatus Paceibacterota bacterium]MBT4652767.1 winged helix-turn-helix transcriptional regulator [Candidatus Paceibacterota bacterium]MBT6755924.1 winged helix-turn-helix transcriptional regulator [Candidatus Paceibacterota bacterium]MBT6921137.1 winged helix-turn-helix transcriptional regulator [Candidatus Paceibacterota bacterium]
MNDYGYQAMKLCIITDSSLPTDIKEKLTSNYLSHFYSFSLKNLPDLSRTLYKICIIFCREPSIFLKKYLKTLNRALPETPFILCLQQGTSQDRYQYMSHTGTNCLSGKICPDELLFKINILSENNTNNNLLKTKFNYNNFSFCFTTKRALYNNITIVLNKKETLLLECLLRRKNMTIPRSFLYEMVWERYKIPSSNALETHMSSLRRKIEKTHEIKLFKTVCGVGYKVSTEY